MNTFMGTGLSGKGVKDGGDERRARSSRVHTAPVVKPGLPPRGLAGP